MYVHINTIKPLLKINPLNQDIDNKSIIIKQIFKSVHKQ